jgi:hypothetical protein
MRSHKAVDGLHRTYPSQLRALHGLLPEISVPVQIIAGRRNPMVPPMTRMCCTNSCLPRLMQVTLFGKMRPTNTRHW